MESSFDFTYSHFPVSEEIVSYIKKKVGIDDNRGFFAFIKAEYKNNFDGEQVNKNNYVKRCDLDSPQGTPLPVDFHSWDVEAEKCTVCGSKTKPHPTTGSHVTSLTNSRTLRMPIQSNYGFVAYIETTDQELEAQAFEDPQNTARTLQELFRLMLEWEWVYLNMNNKEEISKVAHELLNDLSMPEDIKNWIWEEVPPMRVEKFLTNNESPRLRESIDKIPNMTKEFEEWCISLILTRPQVWGSGQP
jgi:hypothetical protein